MECKGGVFTWQTMKTKMAKAKAGLVAFQVPDDFMDKKRYTRAQRRRYIRAQRKPILAFGRFALLMGN